MRTDELNYELPAELIAQEPVHKRSESRLLVLKRGDDELVDSRFSRIGDYLCEGDCLVLNDTKVLAARFFGQRLTGGRLEGLFLCEKEDGLWEVMFKGARKVKEAEEIVIKDKGGQEYCRAAVEERAGEGIVRLRVMAKGGAEEVLEEIGFPPLPPYIKRGRDMTIAEADRRRYQTVYARQAGAVAAPTAGLHFTEELIESLKKKGIKFATITLHVGLGTFRPVTVEKLEEHRMHGERYIIVEREAEIINTTKENGGRVIAVGTTSVRALESSVENGKIKASERETQLFITPGYDFEVVDGMVTNFHLPRSTLLALVGAFAGVERILRAYRHAVERRYRFYSYGDAMLIL